MGARLIGRALAAVALAATASAFAAGPDDVAAAFADAKRTTVDGAGGVPLAVVEKGAPALPAIVFVHGYRQSSLAWFAQFGARLSTRCHLVAFDLRGHGDSGAPWRADAYDNAAVWADDLARVIAATGARKPLIVAWSFGGLVAMDYLRVRGRGDVGGLVLVGTTARLFAPDAAPPPAPPPARSRFDDLAKRAAAVRGAADLVFGPRVDPALRAYFATASARTSPFVDVPSIARGATLDNADLVPLLRSLPVTLVDGTDDAVVPRPLWARTKAVLDRARVVEFEGSGHAPFVDAPDRFDALLEELQCRA